MVALGSSKLQGAPLLGEAPLIGILWYVWAQHVSVSHDCESLKMIICEEI